MSRLSKEELNLLCDLYKQPEDAQEYVIHTAAEELKRYHDLEEQGRLIEQKTGQWKQLDSDFYSNIYFCSNCLVYERVKTVMGKPAFDYCPNCGAKMELKELEGVKE